MFPISFSRFRASGNLRMELALVSVEANPGHEGGAAAAHTPEGRRVFPISFPRLLMFEAIENLALVEQELWPRFGGT